jgi:hypothetical protein
MKRDEWRDVPKLGDASENVIPGYRVPALIMRIMEKKQNGRLTLTCGESERSVSFMRGVISSIASKDPKEKMVARRPYRRKLTDKQREQIDALMETEKIRFGAAMVKLKLVEPGVFNDMLGEHHAFLLTQCILSESIQVHFDSTVKGPADRAPVRFLAAVEEAVKAIPWSARRQLYAYVRAQLFEIGAEVTPMIARLDPTPDAERMFEEAKSGSESGVSLLAVASGSKSRAALAALFLTGALRPVVQIGRFKAKTRSGILAVIALTIAAVIGSLLWVLRPAEQSPVAVVAASPALTQAASQPASSAPVEVKVPEPAPKEAMAPVVDTVSVKCQALFATGLAKLQRGKAKDAIDSLNRARDCAPKNPEIHRALGVAWQNRGKPKQALDAFSRYLSLAPEAPDAALVRLLLGADAPR